MFIAAGLDPAQRSSRLLKEVLNDIGCPGSLIPDVYESSEDWLEQVNGFTVDYIQYLSETPDGILMEGLTQWAEEQVSNKNWTII